MTEAGTHPLHYGLILAGFTCAKPIFTFLFGKKGAKKIFATGRAYAVAKGDPEPFLERLDDTESKRPELDVDAAGFVDFILPTAPAAHARWAAFFYGSCASRHHAPIEALVREETEWDTLSEAFDPWCPNDIGKALSAAIDAGERSFTAGAMDAVDKEIVEAVLQANPIYDVTYPVYLPIIELLRVRRIHHVLGRMSANGAAEVRAHMDRAAA